MILLWVKATDMANDQLVRKAKLSPQLDALVRIIGVCSSVNCVVDNLIRCATEHPVPSILTAGKKVCGTTGDAAPTPELDGIF